MHILEQVRPVPRTLSASMVLPEPVRYLIQAEAGYAKRAGIAPVWSLIYASYVEGVNVGYGRVSACRQVEEIPPGRVKVVKVNERDIAVFNIEGDFHAIYNSCPHAKAGPCTRGA